MAISRFNSIKKYFSGSLLLAFGMVPLQAQEKWDTLYASQYATWVTPHYNLAKCSQYKSNLDSIQQELDKAIPVITKYLGIGPEALPQRVEIDSQSDGMGGWAAGNSVGYQVSDFYGVPANGDGLRWIRGVIIGEVINASTGAVSGDWPLDWWVDHVWYFPGFLAGEILKETVSPDFSAYWLTSESYPTYPVYNLFVSLLGQYGWTCYKDLFARMQADDMKWDKVGQNPSKNKTDYVLAYLSLAAGRNLAGEFQRAMVEDADSAEVGTIMGVETGLREADRRNLNVTSAWNDFRNGNFASAKAALEKLGVSTRINGARFNRLASTRNAFRAMGYSLTGRKLNWGNQSPVAGPQNASSSGEYYIFKDRVIRAE